MKRFTLFCIITAYLLSLSQSAMAADNKLFYFPIQNIPKNITCAYHGYERHNGYDLGAGYGTPIYALFDGTVTYRIRYKMMDDGCYHSYEYGNFLELQSSEPINGDNYSMLVAHLSNFDGNTYTVPGDVHGIRLICDNGTPRWGGITEEIGSMNVKKGQLIGYSGSCGNSTGPHIHIEIRKNGAYVNPDDYISDERCVLGWRIDEENFPDYNFRYIVFWNCDTDRNGFLSDEEAKRVTAFHLSYTYDNNYKFTSLKGIEYFTALTELDCRYTGLTALDISKNTALTKLDCSANYQLTELDVSKNTALKYLDCDTNKLAVLDVSKNTALTELDCGYNQLTTLDLSKSKLLERLDCDSNKLTTLNVSSCTALTGLSCSYNQLTSLNVSGHAALMELYCGNNQLTALNVSGCTALTQLGCQYNNLTTLNVNGCTALTTLSCYKNDLTTLNVSECTALMTLYCFQNGLTTLNASGCTALEELVCWRNQLTTLDMSGCTALTKLTCNSNQLTTLNVSKNTALTELYCYNNQLTELDVSKNTALTELECGSNQLTTLNVSKNMALTGLDCGYNQLTELDVSNHTALMSLSCRYNRLTTIKANNCTALFAIYCDDNDLEGKNIYVINCPNLTDENIEVGYRYYDYAYSPVKVNIIRKNSILSSAVDALSGAVVSVYNVPSILFSSTGKILEAVSEIDSIKNSVAEEDLKYVARGMQVMGMILGGQFYRLLFPVNSPSPSENFAAPPLKMSLRYNKVYLSPDVSPDISPDVSPDKYAEDFRLSETLTLKVSPAGFRMSKNSSTPVKFTVTSPVEVSQDVYCTIVSGDNCNYFMLPRADESGRKFEAEFPSGEIFTSIDACEAEVMCVSCLSDDGGIYGMQMSNTVKVSWTVETGKAPSVTGGTLPQAKAGQKYSYQLNAESSTAVTWTKSGNFPEGLTLSVTGLVSGTPKSASTYTLKVTAANDYGTTSATFTLKVTAGSSPTPTPSPSTKPTITTSTTTLTIPTGTAFSLQLAATGTTPITWTKTGSLPTGLNLSKEGLISGTPKSAQTKTFKVTAKNKQGSDTKSFTITVYVPVSITTAKLADGTADKNYNTTLKAKGSNVVWSATGLPDGLSINSKTGKISGKTSKYGEYSVVVRAENSSTHEEKTFTLTIKGVAPTISGSLKTPELNKSYSSGLKVKGTQPIEWSISGNLPDGLTFNEETGVISGTPTSYLKSGYKITITAKGPGGSKSKTVTLKVKGTAPTITGTLKQAELYKAYSAALKVKGSDTIKLSMSGELPDGLTFDEETGTISGTPKSYEKSGYKFTVTATNPVGSKSKTFTLKVKGTAPTISGSLKSPELNKAYSGSLKVKGTEPITWSMSGELPDGLTFDEETGTISGTATSYSKSGYKITITASNIVGTKSKKITLKVKGTAPSIKTTKLPNATQWSSYSVALNATGSDPITWRAEGLPNGLSLNGNTIEGTPTVSGKKFTVTVYAENPVKEVKKNLSLRIDAAPEPETVKDTKSPKDTETSPAEPSDKSTPPEQPEQEVPESPEDDEDTAHSEGEYVVVARLGEISRDVEGMYDFDVTLSDDAVVGAELVYIANSSEPSNDDEIAEFFDDTGKEITEVPDSRHITISIWLHAKTIYNPSIAVKH